VSRRAVVDPSVLRGQLREGRLRHARALAALRTCFCTKRPRGCDQGPPRRGQVLGRPDHRLVVAEHVPKPCIGQARGVVEREEQGRGRAIVTPHAGSGVAAHQTTRGSRNRRGPALASASAVPGIVTRRGCRPHDAVQPTPARRVEIGGTRRRRHLASSTCHRLDRAKPDGAGGRTGAWIRPARARGKQIRRAPRVITEEASATCRRVAPRFARSGAVHRPIWRRSGEFRAARGGPTVGARGAHGFFCSKRMGGPDVIASRQAGRDAPEHAA